MGTFTKACDKHSYKQHKTTHAQSTPDTMCTLLLEQNARALALRAFMRHWHIISTDDAHAHSLQAPSHTIHTVPITTGENRSSCMSSSCHNHRMAWSKPSKRNRVPAFPRVTLYGSKNSQCSRSGWPVIIARTADIRFVPARNTADDSRGHTDGRSTIGAQLHHPITMILKYTESHRDAICSPRHPESDLKTC